MLGASCLASLVEAQRATGADVVSSDVLQFTHNDVSYATMPSWSRDTFRTTTPVWFTTLVRADLARDVGGWDPTQHHWDRDLWYRLFKRGVKHVHLPLHLWRYRRGPQQGTHGTPYDDAQRVFLAKHPELAA